MCQRDGRWFLKLLQAETDRMEGWCRQMELDQRENDLPEDSMFLCVSGCSSSQCFIILGKECILYQRPGV